MIIRRASDLYLALSLLNNAYTVVFDVETTGLNVRKDKLIGFGLCNVDTMKACYIVTKEWTGSHLRTVITNDEINPLLERLSKKKLVTHNGSYDTRITYHDTGVELWPALHADTMLMAHTIDENKFSYALKDLATQMLGADSKDAQAAMKASIAANGGESKEYYKADSELMATYGLQDVIMTAKLYNKFNDELKQQDLTKFFYEDEVMQLYKNVTIPMELRGIPVDIPALEIAYAEITADMERIEDSIQGQIAPNLDKFFDWYINKEYPFKLSGESKQVLAEMIPVDNWPKTKTGTYSFAKVDYERAIKKGLVAAGSDLEAYCITLLKHVPQQLQRQVSLELLRRQGTKYTFNLLSKHHLKKLFFDTLKETALSFTDKGSPQVDDDFLELMAAKYPWCAELQTYNKLTKIKGTYYERFLHESENGIFYPQFAQHRTTSGRYSGDTQQMSRKKSEEELPDHTARKYTNKIRDFIISGEGHKLVDADYSSLEVVVFADDAADEALLEIIRKDLDFYSQIAIQVWGLKEYSADKKAPNFLKKHKPELRQAAKAFALGIRYGLGDYKLSKDLNIPQEEAATIVSGYMASFPQLAARMQALVTQAKTQGYVKSKAGRVRHLGELAKLVAEHGEVLFNGLELWKKFNNSPSYYSYMKMQARKASNLVNNSLNFPIQSMAASIVSRASIALARAFKERSMSAYIALSIHDELCVRCPDCEVSAVTELMQYHMENTTRLSVPLQAEPVVGECYGNVK